MKWTVGVAIALLLLAWYGLASIQGNEYLHYTPSYVALVILLLVCTATAIWLVRCANKASGTAWGIWAIIGMWAVLIVGGEFGHRYVLSQRAIRNIELEAPFLEERMKNVGPYVTWFRIELLRRTLDRMGPFVSAERKQAVREQLSKARATADKRLLEIDLERRLHGRGAEEPIP